MLTHTTNGITVNQFTWDVLDSNSYIIAGNDSALMIDVIDDDELLFYSGRFKKVLVLLTHAHYDHICGLNRLRALNPDVVVYASETCSRNIQDPRTNLSNIANALMAFHEHKDVTDFNILPFSCDPADITYTDKVSFEWENHEIQMIEFHGHSKDSSCIIIDKSYLFSGDTILSIPTVTRLPGGNTKCFWEKDIPRLEEIKDHIHMVFPGHKEPGDLQSMLYVNIKEHNRKGGGQ